eukprot:gnl/TRDRNA2_/TRDRNA2_173653_c10_seq22.p1 gnl/TRDRNA2_/TRDRNA2_173653_c10~~gnl/TRDRNA2_/TRDRNA2_173653_c10_seq22.p1  ORF type:complete len:180 (-),score=27.07 gnl/TRDRNA2_/TRDRNA2_173653_c10_seq22:94-633(-)
MFRTLLDACRAVGDFVGASRVQAAVAHFGLIAFPLLPAATALIQASQRQWENGVSSTGMSAAQALWSELCRCTAYEPRLQILPWAFVQISTCKLQEGSLQLHAEKKSLAMLLVCNETHLSVSINFNACADCHEFFKSTSLLFGRTIRLRQPRMVHTFLDGCCSCKDQWRWESRLVQMPP